jgi:hypothetical protein
LYFLPVTALLLMIVESVVFKSLDTFPFALSDRLDRLENTSPGEFFSDESVLPDLSNKKLGKKLVRIFILLVVDL